MTVRERAKSAGVSPSVGCSLSRPERVPMLKFGCESLETWVFRGLVHWRAFRFPSRPDSLPWADG